MAQAPNPDREPIVEREVQRLLDDVPAYRGLDPATQRALSRSMTDISSYLAGIAEPQAGLSRQLAPNLQEVLAPQAPGGSPGASPGAPPAPGTAQTPAPPGGSGPVGRVGEVTRATLNAIDFPAFVGSLIQGTFQAIVDASIQQMEAYAKLVENVAGTVDQFMQDNITDGHARDYLADQFDGFMVRDTSSGTPRLLAQPDALPEGELPSFFRDLGFEDAGDVDDQAIEEVVVPATRRTLAEQRQQVLSTMVLMGINRVVVDDGEISAKLQFHIDASEETEIRFDQSKTTIGNISKSGKTPFTANGLLVNTTSLNAQSDLNIRTDLTGQVKVKFRSETFPLERFADSPAIQLINSHARVPSSQPALQGGTAPDTAASAPPPTVDPWAPR